MSGDPASTRKHGIRSRPWWPWARRLLTLAFFSLVAYLLYTQARSIEWGSVFKTMQQRPLQGMLIAAALAAGSYSLYACFDLLGRHMTGHRLGTLPVWLVTFISYAFNLNIGSFIGGVAFRYRLYSRHGLGADVVTRVVAMSMLTNWLGYLLLGGLVFWWRPLPLPPDWKLDSGGLRLLGVALVAVVAAYLLLCAFSRRRTWVVRGHELNLPSLRMALLQLAMSSVNWLMIAGVMYTLLEQKVDYPTVLSVLLLAAIAGVIVHVPAGLGVIEAVFVALLSYQLPRNELLASLLMYRAIYYLAPLIVATLLYLAVELRVKPDK